MMKKTKILTSATVTFLLLTMLLSVSASASTSQTFILSQESTYLQYTLPKGTTFNCAVSTTGTVRFWVNGPNFTQIVRSRLIDKTQTFSFVSQQDGTYMFNFENDLPNTVQVTFSYDTNPQIPSSGSTGIPLTYLLVTALIIVVGSVLIVLLVRRKNKRENYAVQTATSLGKFAQKILCM